MRKLFILFTLLIWTVLPLAPVKAAAVPSCANPAAFTLDGVDLTLCLPFAVGAFRLPAPEDKIQAASAVDASGQRELAITVMPLGVQPGSEILPVLQSGQEQGYRAMLQDFRSQHGGMLVGSPQLSLFGQSVTGATNVLSLAVDGVHPQPVQISEWLTEAGGRIWLVRLSQNLPAGTNALQPQAIPGGLTLSALDPAAPSTSLSSLQAAPPAPPALPTPQAVLANLPTPTWWNGDCDTVNYQAKNPGHPAYPLGASYLGMKACGPRFFDYRVDTLVSFFPGAYGQLEWECVELSMRFMYLAYGVPPYGANGNQVVSAYRGSRLVKISNKTVGKAPQPGDVMSYGLSSTVGHTTVVTASNVDAYGNGTVSIIEQNDSVNGTRTDTVTNWYVNDSIGVIGWLHDPTYDNQQPPIVTFSPLNPAPNHWYNNTGQTIAWSSSDYVGMWGYSQAWDADPSGTAPQVTASASGSADLSELSEGQHTLYVRVWDNSPSHHSQVTASGWYGIDNSPPDGRLTSFLENEPIITHSLPLGVTLTDSGGSGLGHARITASWAGQSAVEVVSNISAAGVYPWDLCLSGVPNGQPVSVSLDVWDAAGNVTLAAGGARHFIKNYACGASFQVSLDGPTHLAPSFTTASDECTDYWKQITDLNGRPAYLTLNADTAANSTNSARWNPSLPAAGQYKVEAFIPHYTALQLCHTTPPGPFTTHAAYLIQYQGGSANVVLNQSSFSDGWADLGSYTFAAGATGYVQLSDLTGEAKLSRYVVFGALRFTPLAASATCYGLNLGIYPAGSARVAVTPPNCGGSQYVPGTAVQVTLSPPPGATFSRWEGSQGGGSSTLKFIMNADQAVVAYFSSPHSIFVPMMTK